MKVPVLRLVHWCQDLACHHFLIDIARCPKSGPGPCPYSRPGVAQGEAEKWLCKKLVPLVRHLFDNGAYKTAPDVPFHILGVPEEV